MVPSISLSRPLQACLGLLLLATLAQGAEQRYVAFFSAETENYRRLLLDGVGGRRVEVRSDSLGIVTVSIWGVTQDDYVGRRFYEQGYLVPVTMRVDFPRRDLMTIRITGNRFADVISYELLEPNLFVIDLYPRPLPQESIFRERTISALWPSGRFEPDMGAGTVQPELRPAPAPGSKRLGLSRALAWELGPYWVLLKRAILWAVGASLGLALLAIPLIFWWRGRRLPVRPKKEAARAGGSAQAIMAGSEALSYDEASLLAELENDRTRATA